LYQNYKDNELTDAIFEDDYARVRSALEAGDDVINLVDIEDLWGSDHTTCHECGTGLQFPESQATPLQLAVHHSSYEVFRLVVESLPPGGSAMNARGICFWEEHHHYSSGTFDGRSALEIAADLGLYEFVQLLLNRGASMEGHTSGLSGDEFNSPLTYAVHFGSQATVSKLIKFGETFDFSHLVQAVNHGWSQLVDDIIKSAPKDIGRLLPELFDRETGKPVRISQTLLDVALKRGDDETAKILKNAGALTSHEAQVRLLDSLDDTVQNRLVNLPLFEARKFTDKWQNSLRERW
jgi:hypothetical protein